ncbi:hydrolase [Enterococcus faecium]|nr:hydrolase [Enterococcus faecium]
MINGVQKLAFAIIIPTKRKISGAIFSWLFLLLYEGKYFHTFFMLLDRFQCNCY